MTPKHAGPSDADWVAWEAGQTQDKMRVSITSAAIEWSQGKRSAHSLKKRVQYWLRRLCEEVSDGI